MKVWHLKVEGKYDYVRIIETLEREKKEALSLLNSESQKHSALLAVEIEKVQQANDKIETLATQNGNFLLLRPF